MRVPRTGRRPGHLSAPRLTVWILIALLVWGASETQAIEGAGQVDTLALVNGDPITSADLDTLILQKHTTGRIGGLKTSELRNLLKKAINDRLILQEAVAIGLDEEASIVTKADESRARRAVRAFVSGAFHPPTSVDDDTVRAYFEEQYWKIGIRQISVRGEDEAAALRERIAAGAAMDSIARAVSIDSKRYRGGLHNVKYWADVENVIRDNVKDLGVGELSDPFPYRKAYSIVRVEERLPVEQDAFSEVEEAIRSYLSARKKARAWAEFVDTLKRENPVRLDEAVLARIRRDSAEVFQGSFVDGSDDPVLSIGETHRVSEAELRKAISRTAMSAATSPFESILNQTLDAETRDLVLLVAAEQGHYFDREDVVQAYERELNDALIEAYLAETVVPKIVFNRQEFTDYYNDHLEDFRGPDEVRLSMIMVDDEAEAREIEARLKSGADFAFVERQRGRIDAEPPGEPQWASVRVFSDEIRGELEKLDVGGISKALQTPTGWLVFKVDGRRKGRLQSLEEVDIKIRQVMFQKKFNEHLDAHLNLLKERSEIVLDQDKIDAYFGPGTWEADE